MKTPSKPLTIFRRGRHTPTSGDTTDFSDNIIRASVEAYDPKVHEAPLVIGHPKDTAPAYGWVESLSFSEAGDLLAVPRQVEPQFAEIVNAGRYKKISSSFYPPNHPSNPKPGVYYLRHVGFFGAQPVAVKGMPDASFSDDSDGCLTIEFSDGDGLSFVGRALARVMRSLREYVLEKDGRETADKIVPEYMADSAFYEPPKTVSYSETETPKETNVEDPNKPKTTAGQPGTEDFAERERQVSEREKAIKAEEAKLRRKHVVDFVETLAKDPASGKGRILPKHKAGLVEFMCQAEESLGASAVIEFSEDGGADKKVKKSPMEFLRDMLQELPPVIDYSERAGSKDSVPADFSEVDSEAQKIAKAQNPLS